MPPVQIAFIFMNGAAAFSPLQQRSAAVLQNATTVTWCSAQSPPGRDGGISLANQPGSFAWYELLTTDVAAAGAFYGKVIGWGGKDASTPQMAYTVLTSGDAPIGGLMDIPEEGRRMGATPRWVGYVAVDDIDATAAQIRRRGGAVLLPPTDSNIGRVSVVADPQNATFALVSGLTYGQRQPGGMDDLGRVGWHELLAQDRNKIFDFYGELFGWQKAEGEIDHADLYQSFSAAGQTIGGMLTKLPACSRAGSITSMTTTSAWPPGTSKMAEAGFSRVRSNCLTVAGSRDVPIPKVPCLHCRALGARRKSSNPLPRKSPGPPSGATLLHRAGWCCESRSARQGLSQLPPVISSHPQLNILLSSPPG